MNSSSLPTLITQLQARYPTASLTSELLTIHQDSYVVRAVVRAGSIILATGLAAAVDIEQAEDRAKYRALSGLGIDQSSALASLASEGSSVMSPPPFQGATNPIPVPLVASVPSTASAASPLVETPDRTQPVAPSAFSSYPPSSQPGSVADVPPQPTAETESPLASSFSPSNFDYSSTEYQSDYAAISFDPAHEPSLNLPIESSEAFVTASSESATPIVSALPELEAEPSPAKNRSADSEKATPAKKTKRKTEPNEAPLVTAETDRSEEIAKIGLEMKRLGWTTEQGRNYLKRTYGKRSRQELDDTELIDFLRYLEFQPSPSESPF